MDDVVEANASGEQVFSATRVVERLILSGDVRTDYGSVNRALADIETQFGKCTSDTEMKALAAETKAALGKRMRCVTTEDGGQYFVTSSGVEINHDPLNGHFDLPGVVMGYADSDLAKKLDLAQHEFAKRLHNDDTEGPVSVRRDKVERRTGISVTGLHTEASLGDSMVVVIPERSSFTRATDGQKTVVVLTRNTDGGTEPSLRWMIGKKITAVAEPDKGK